jgi:hypothetical protein
MTPEPLAAALDQLAAHHEQIAQLDAREARHFALLNEHFTQLAGMLTNVSHALHDDTAAFARDCTPRAIRDAQACSPP